MKNAIKMLIAVATLMLLSSFRFVETPEFIGTYGGASTDPAQIELRILSDGTFFYQDLSNPKNKKMVSGSWVQKGNKVVLQGNEADTKFHRIWRFENQGQVAKSRMGLAFYRLCKK